MQLQRAGRYGVLAWEKQKHQSVMRATGARNSTPREVFSSDTSKRGTAIKKVEKTER